jgi:hypothetical protein
MTIYNKPTGMVPLRTQKNTKHQGDVGLSLAIAWFAVNNYLVFLPLTDSHDYDLVIEDGDGNLKKVQVRTTYHYRDGKYTVSLKVSGGNRSGTGKIKHFEQGLYDYLFVVVEDGSKYLIPSKAIHCRSTLTLCEKYEDYRVG